MSNGFVKRMCDAIGTDRSNIEKFTMDGDMAYVIEKKAKENYERNVVLQYMTATGEFIVISVGPWYHC